MGRAERRRQERNNRIEDRKGKLLMSRESLKDMLEEACDDKGGKDTEALMTCFVLALHELYGFGSIRSLKVLRKIDDLMGLVVSGQRNIDDFKQEVEEKVGIKIEC